jgi:HlyD family secretion protein
MRRSLLFVAFVSSGLLASLSAAPQPPDSSAGPQTPEKKNALQGTTAKAPETVAVEKGKFQIDVTCKGTLEAEETAELFFHLDTWTGMTVAKAIPHGTRVKQGDVLVELDLEKIDKALKDVDLEREMSDIAHQQAEEDLRVTEKLFPLDLAAAEQAYKYSQEDTKKFFDADLPFAKKNAEFQAKSSKNFLEYAQEELKQLEKMYRADDIKEETEEIILKRQRDTVESARNNLSNVEKRTDDLLKIDLPRREQATKESATRATINWEKAKITMPAGLKQKQLAFEKTKHDRAKANERFDQLKSDRAKMAALKAPCDGVVYYGKCTKGSWNSSSLESRLVPKGGPLSNDEVILTIVKSNKMAVRSTLDEKDRPLVKVGAVARVTPTALPDEKLSATVQSIADVPLGTNFDVRFGLGEHPSTLVPGMTATVKIKAYAKEDALTLPAGAVFTDEKDEDQHVVYFPGKEGKDPVKKSVTIGKRSGDKIEILDGVQAGEMVLKEKPKKSI